jgi:hypothetical protein
MDSLGNITGLASIIGVGGVNAVSPSKGISAIQNNTALLSSLADNTVLRGVVQSKGANNIITLRTEQGTLTLQTDVFLRRGAEVAIKIEQKLNDALIRIISVGGQSLTKYLEGTAGTSVPDAVARSSSLISPASAAPENAGAAATEILTEEATAPTVLRGVFLAPFEATASTASRVPTALQVPLQQASAGTSLQIQVLAIAIPQMEGEGGYIPLAANAAALPLPTSTGIPMAGYGITPAQRIAVEPYQQTVVQNQQAATASLPLMQEASDVLIPTLPTVTTAPIADTPETISFSSVSVPTSTQAATTLPVQLNALIASLADEAPLPVPLQPNAASPPLAAPSMQLTTLPPMQTESGLLLPLPANLPAIVSPNALVGIVIQATAPRELTVQTDIGIIKLFVTTPLPKGTIIQFTLQQVTEVRQSVGTTAVADESELPLRLRAMEEIVALQHPALSVQHPFPAHLIPRAGSAMGAEILFLLKALQGGSLRSWMGEENATTLDALASLERKEGGKGDLLSRLNAEFSSLKTLPESVSDGVWRSVLIPIYDQGTVQPLQYFFKKQQHSDGKSADKQTDHFMVDVELTRMGRLQLDGLVQKQTPRLQFDLIIRTEQPWGEEIRQTIREIFTRAQAISGFSGMVSFRHGLEAIVPLPDQKESLTPSHLQSFLV